MPYTAVDEYGSLTSRGDPDITAQPGPYADAPRDCNDTSYFFNYDSYAQGYAPAPLQVVYGELHADPAAAEFLQDAGRTARFSRPAVEGHDPRQFVIDGSYTRDVFMADRYHGFGEPFDSHQNVQSPYQHREMYRVLPAPDSPLKWQHTDGASKEDEIFSRKQHDYEEQEEEGSEKVEDKILEAAREAFLADNLTNLSLPPISTSEIDQHLAAEPLGALEPAQILQNTLLTDQEKWIVDRESAQLLADVLSMSKRCDDNDFLLRDHVRLGDLKVEEPALSVDPETDMIQLRRRNEVQLSTKDMKPFALAKERDESLAWSQKNLGLPQEIKNRLAAERLEVERETVEYLKDICGVPAFDLGAWLAKKREREAPIKSVSPPLLPLSPAYSPGRLSSPAAQLELTSTPEDPSVHEKSRLEKAFAEQDDIAMHQQHPGADNFLKESAKMTDSVARYSPSSISGPSSFSQVNRRSKRLRDLKVSSPVLPQEKDHDDQYPLSKKAKTVTFLEEIATMIPEPEDTSPDPQMALDKALEAIEALAAPLASPALERSNNEDLSEFDTILRVPVPSVPEIEATAPWEKYAKDQLRPLIRYREDALAEGGGKWQGISKLTGTLPWAPFPMHMGKIRPEGDFDDGSLARYLNDLNLECDVKSTDLVWKPEGLGLLDANEDEDDEVAPARSNEEEETNVASVGHQGTPQPEINALPPKPSSQLRVKEPRMESTVTAPSQADPPQRNDTLAAQTNNRADSVMTALLQKRKAEIEKSNLGMVTSATAKWLSKGPLKSMAQQNTGDVRSALDNFGQHLNWSDRLAGVERGNEKGSQKTKTVPATAHVPDANSLVSAPHVVRPKVSIPTPRLEVVEEHIPVIVASATIGSHRYLVRMIERLLPGLEVFQRDPVVRSRFTANGAKQDVSLSDQEADITISASTGIIFTNLQKIKQKPLPGQGSSFFGIREQVTAVACRYERLIVLVGDGRNMSGDGGELPALDESDTDALFDLILLASLLESEVQVTFVAGREQELLQWIAAAICRYGQRGRRLIADETTWERFLRKAGFNAFAAQVIMKEITDSTPSGNANAATAGLADFVMMGDDERMARFAGFLGGEEVLRRVSKTLALRWPSASSAVI